MVDMGLAQVLEELVELGALTAAEAMEAAAQIRYEDATQLYGV